MSKRKPAAPKLDTQFTKAAAKFLKDYQSATTAEWQQVTQDFYNFTNAKVRQDLAPMQATLDAAMKEAEAEVAAELAAEPA
jgi:hypothetical protein